MEGGLSDTVLNYSAINGAATAAITAATSQDPDVVITVTDAANIAQFNTIDGLTTSDIVLTGGLTDTAANYSATDGTATSGVTAATTQDPDVVITVTDVANIAQFNAIDNLTTSNIVLTGGLTDTAANYSATDGTATSGITAATTQDPDVAITVTDDMNANQFNTIDALTTGAVTGNVI